MNISSNQVEWYSYFEADYKLQLNAARKAEAKNVQEGSCSGWEG